MSQGEGAEKQKPDNAAVVSLVNPDEVSQALKRMCAKLDARPEREAIDDIFLGVAKRLETSFDQLRGSLKGMSVDITAASSTLCRTSSTLEDIHHDLQKRRRDFQNRNGGFSRSGAVRPEERKTAQMELIEGLAESLASYNPWLGM